MATKTIGVDESVYAKLRRLKRETESFTRLLDRLAGAVGRPRTVGQLLDSLGGWDVAPLSESEGELMDAVIRENARSESWPIHDLS